MKLYYLRCYNWQGNYMTRLLLTASSEEAACNAARLQLTPRDRIEEVREVCPADDDIYMEVS
ncbi:MAG: hypothetical protein HY856_13435 [Burkholderiales bacterium]|nr:hypothetical protein [Burkholderiales bacterium]